MDKRCCRLHFDRALLDIAKAHLQKWLKQMAEVGDSATVHRAVGDDPDGYLSILTNDKTGGCYRRDCDAFCVFHFFGVWSVQHSALDVSREVQIDGQDDP